MIDRRTFIGTSLGAIAASNLVSQPARAADGEMVYVNVGTGADTNPGTRQSPPDTLRFWYW